MVSDFLPFYLMIDIFFSGVDRLSGNEDVIRLSTKVFDNTWEYKL